MRNGRIVVRDSMEGISGYGDGRMGVKYGRIGIEDDDWDKGLRMMD